MSNISTRRGAEPQAAGADSGIVDLVNQIFAEASRAGASDIHIEPQVNDVVIRYRIDGILQVRRKLPIDLLQQIMSRIKIMSKLDVTERRLPMDGRISFGRLSPADPEIDLRVSTVPLLMGEKCCLRIVYTGKEQGDIDLMGYSAHNLPMYKSIVDTPTGMLLHCGPAGSGKTTALYAAVRYLHQPGRNISTAEDPIEYQIPGVNQAQVNPEQGLTFARILRAYMRQDCNVILIGEIRDNETCEIAIQAALTGHMILGTLHAMSCTGAIARLHEMGISSYFIGSALKGVVSQRLVRRLCQKCKQATAAPPRVAEALRLTPGQPIYKAVGCKACGNLGYKGRMTIHEVMKPDDAVRDLIYNEAPPTAIEEAAARAGMVPLWLDGLEKAKSGDTSV
ncbi:MAG TPA: GspE/PulE family protein, partial [Planctomycetota bacterium]|nr:GspE/PulE family protein [Planctomycetota bacterium]